MNIKFATPEWLAQITKAIDLCAAECWIEPSTMLPPFGAEVLVTTRLYDNDDIPGDPAVLLAKLVCVDEEGPWFEVVESDIDRFNDVEAWMPCPSPCIGRGVVSKPVQAPETCQHEPDGRTKKAPPPRHVEAWRAPGAQSHEDGGVR